MSIACSDARRPTARRAWLCLLGALALGCGSDPRGPLDAAPPDGASIACARDLDCDDGLACTGLERCVAGACAPGVAIDCDDGDACTTDACSEEADGACTHQPVDADRDGHVDAACGGDDCDDSDPQRFPGNTEVCDLDGRDEDCDPSTFGALDLDGDGAIDARCCNTDGAGTTRCGTDCDDVRASVRPGATEVCNRRDDDCNGVIDEGVTVTVYVDADRDLHGAPGPGAPGCAGMVGFSPIADDCDDHDVHRHGAMVELCDGVDNDCDGSVDETPTPAPWYVDADGDGFGARHAAPVWSCAPVPGHSLLATDCDDARAAVSPLAAERCDGLDNDCSGHADFEIAPGDFEDDDGDGVPDAACAVGVGDCDDTDPHSWGGGAELCDGRDNDCDGAVDERVATVVWLRDRDGDGYGDEASGGRIGCEPIDGYVSRAGDCDDDDPVLRPGAAEACNLRDDDCDGRVDEASDATCAVAGGAGRCVAGSCTIDACMPDRADCDGVYANGCERAIGTETDCGGCGDACAATEACVAGQCRPTCGGATECGGLACCDGACFDTAQSIHHCGACGTACPLGGLCIAGACVAACVPSTETCNGADDDCDGLVDDGVCVCGDGLLDSGEACDDGNTSPGDGCSATCQVELAECGNGVLEPGEVCDDGPDGACADDCLALCGDGILGPGEACDDGNLSDSDGCQGMCTVACGDGIHDLGWEACDDGNRISGDGCSADCNSACGDSNVDPAEGETCDDGNLVPGDGCGATCISECGAIPSADIVGTAGGTIVAMESDGAGNIYVLVSQPRGSVTYGPVTINNADLEPDTVVWSLTATGAHRWVMHGGGATGWAQPHDLAVDTAGNVYVTGVVLGGPVTFGPTTITPGTGNYDVFVWSLTPAGVHRWAISDGSSSSAERGHAVTVDDAGNVYVGGTYVVSTTIGGVPLTGGQGYVWSLTSTGATRWVASGGPVDALAYGRDLVGSGRVFAVGTFSAGVINVGSYVVTGAGGDDVAVWAHDASDGTIEWALSGGGVGSDRVFDAKTDPGGSLYIGIQSGADAAFGSLATHGAGAEDVVVWSLDGTGATRWAARSASPQGELGSHLAISGAAVYAVGTLALGSGVFGAASLSGSGGEGFIASASTAMGDWTCARSFGGSGDDNGAGIAATGGALAVMGVSGSSDFLVGGAGLPMGRVFFSMNP